MKLVHDTAVHVGNVAQETTSLDVDFLAIDDARFDSYVCARSCEIASDTLCSASWF